MVKCGSVGQDSREVDYREDRVRGSDVLYFGPSDTSSRSSLHKLPRNAPILA